MVKVLAAAAFVACASVALGFNTLRPTMMAADSKRVLIIGGSRFSGLYLFKELHERGHKVTLFNRGKTANKPVPGESEAAFKERIAAAQFIKGDRTSIEDLERLAKNDFDVIYDMNGREVTDTKPLGDLYKGRVEHFVYMSSAGVYLKSDLMPHKENDAVDPKSRHKGKLDTEEYLAQSGLPWTSIRPTYIYGPGNYNPLEEYFFDRVANDRPVCVPGHGDHLTGLGHVKDLAVAMAQVIGRPQAKNQIYNIQHPKAVSFDGVAKLAAKAAGKDVKIVHYDPKKFDFGKKKAFPMRPQHFYTSVEKAIKDLDWTPAYDNLAGIEDSFKNDYLVKKAEGKLKPDFETDDLVLGKVAA